MSAPTSTQISPSDDDLRASIFKIKTANPSLGIGKIRSSVLQENPTWQLSENRVKKICQAEGLINAAPAPTGAPKEKEKKSEKEKAVFPVSRVVEDLDIERWTGRVQVRFIDKRKGKGLFAKEKIAEGEVIWKEDPFIVAPEWELFDLVQNGRACTHCTTPLTDSSLTVHCSASSSTAYCPARFCNRLCHTRAQRVHPLLCPAQNPASTPLIKFARASAWLGLHALTQCTARLLLDHAMQGEDAKTFEDEWKVVNALATLGMEERSKSGWIGGSEPDKVVWKKAYKLYVQAFDSPTTPADGKKLARLLKNKLPEHLHNQIFTYEGFLQGLGRMALNLEAHGGLYTLHSHMNHTCDPNASVRHLDQRSALSRITILAKRSIEPGEELLISYVDPSLSVKRRREQLGAWNFGVCKCVKCVKEEKEGGMKEDGVEKTKEQSLEELEKELKMGLGVM
ncbi:SET domain-containing protein [Peniophora sp. CONT]|nr:SET domain-containing protein [Peniophora sp. CONT]